MQELTAVHFVSKLSDADGEQTETQHWIATAFACGYILKEEQNSTLS
ncbi:MAG: four helix bundle protein [Verrucomicrobiae bacterium]|nr:four helix bundle protein [Verrucomicrobiae bacterium]